MTYAIRALIAGAHGHDGDDAQTIEIVITTERPITDPVARSLVRLLYPNHVVEEILVSPNDMISDLPATPREAFEALSGKRPDLLLTQVEGSIQPRVWIQNKTGARVLSTFWTRNPGTYPIKGPLIQILGYFN